MKRDRTLVFAAAFLRALGVGMVSVLLGYHVAALAQGATTLGFVIAAGLAGTTLATLYASFRGDTHGRRRLLLALALLSTLGATALVLAGNATTLALAALLGMVNASGRDRGAAMVIEHALLPATTDDRGRTQAFATYNAVMDLGHALGSLLAAVPSWLVAGGFGPLWAQRAGMGLYAVLLGASGLLYLFLSPAVETTRASGPSVTVSPETRGRLARISGLFAIDSLGGGFIPTALVAYWFFKRFGAGEEVMGLLFFGARILNALSHFGAAWLSRRIGLVNTMVFTHIPSSLLLCTVTFAPTLQVAVLLFLLREGLSSMDVPTRQSYVMAMVRPQERLLASGVTTLARNAGGSISPALAGAAMSSALAAPLYVAAALKIGYDLTLWRAFRRLSPPEEASAG